MNILHIDSSAAGDHSYSRRFSHELVERLKAANPGATVVTRDLVTESLPHATSALVSAIFSSPETHDPEQKEAFARSEQATNELLAADIVVIGAPMYNFGIPSNLKAWIDHVVRAGRTFTFTENGAVGLLKAATKLYIVAARGGYYTEGSAKLMEHQDSYLRAVFAFMGVKDITVIPVEGVHRGPEAQAKAVADAEAMVKQAA